MIEVTIDSGSGFCFGVVNAIKSVERELAVSKKLFCLGDLVHNNLEMDRLKSQGLQTINHADFQSLKNCTVLLRAHGEPPSTYQLAQGNNIKIVDATCPVVLRLQRRIHTCYKEKGSSAQLVIYGKAGHAEVNGLVGQTDGTAIVIERIEDITKIDTEKDIVLFSQTTMPLDGFATVIEQINNSIKEGVNFTYYDTICREVANRLPHIRDFASKHDWIYFVAGKKSSNGKVLFEQCKQTNPNSIFITSAEEVSERLPDNIQTVGICGATSTPKWLMEDVARQVKKINFTNMR